MGTILIGDPAPLTRVILRMIVEEAFPDWEVIEAGTLDEMVAADVMLVDESLVVDGAIVLEKPFDREGIIALLRSHPPYLKTCY